MKLGTYRTDAGLRACVLGDGRAVDVADAADHAGLVSGNLDTEWTSVRTVIAASATDRERLARAVDQAFAEGRTRPLDRLRLGPPIPDPDKIVCVGLNYHAHASEVDLQPGTAPEIFAKYRNSLAGPADPIPLPPASTSVDYEGELAVVIGRRCRNVERVDATGYVAGYMVMNDVSARDLQLRGSQWLAGKTFDGFAPCGPALVTWDEIPDVGNLAIVTSLNGVAVQQANTSQMIHDVPAIVSYLSTLMTLEPGDIIATGTPQGVGMSHDPPRFLRDGDRVDVEISGLGRISNLVVDDADDRSGTRVEVAR